MAEFEGWKRRCVPPPIQSPGSLNMVTKVVGAAAATAGPASAHADVATNPRISLRSGAAILPLLAPGMLMGIAKQEGGEPVAAALLVPRRLTRRLRARTNRLALAASSGSGLL